ncbi:glycosyltransferase [Undibacterium arcticum]
MPTAMKFRLFARPAKVMKKTYEVIEGVHIYRYDLLLEAKGAIGYLMEYSLALFHTFRLTWKVHFERGFDVIHACNPPDLFFLIGAFFSSYSCTSDFCLIIMTSTQNFMKQKFGRRDLFYKLMLFLERWTFKTADVSIATNESYRRIAIERGGMAPDKVHVVRSGPQLDRLRLLPPKDELKRGRKISGWLCGCDGGRRRGSTICYRQLTTSSRKWRVRTYISDWSVEALRLMR